MKYKSLVGLTLKIIDCKYICEHWGEKSSPCDRGNTEGLISRHQICDKPGVFFGLECVYQSYEDTPDTDFIYPISHLEELGRIPEGYLLEETYELY